MKVLKKKKNKKNNITTFDYKIVVQIIGIGRNKFYIYSTGKNA